MCGIAGIVALRDGLEPPTREQLATMASALRHRGPEEFGVYRDSRAGLAHARLSIIDLATGSQPLANEDQTLWITFNGEIFNYVELRVELEELGHRFRTKSDTEVIVHAYEAWGESAFERFNGQFALALWNSVTKTLVLARDPVGVRPIYTCEHAGRLYFASEVKAIFAAEPGINRAFDAVGLDQVFTFWSTVPPRTVFTGVTELEPGHASVYRAGVRTDRAFSAPKFPEGPGDEFQGSPDDAVDATRAALEKATRLRMLRADVPVGSYLSGGLDSSLVAALAYRATEGRLQTFSLRFAEAEYDETAYQRLMVERLGSDHHDVMVTRADIARVFPDVVYHAERPVLRAAPAPLFLLSALVRDAGIKVVVTGEGADEVFAGYDLFREAKIRRFWARQPASSWRPLLFGRLYPYMARSPVARPAMAQQFFGLGLGEWASPGFGHGPRWRSAAALKRLFSADMRSVLAGRDAVGELLGTLPPEFVRWSFLAQDQYLEMRTLLAGYILPSQGDRMMMAHSVEGRFPFLDKDVVALAHSLPASHKLRVLDEKHVVKRAARDLVPAEIVTRKKQPYRAPDAVSFAGPAAPAWVAEAVSPAAVREAGVFDPAAVDLLWRKCTTRANDATLSNADNMALVGVLSTQILHERLVRRLPEAGPSIAPTILVEA
ncbi:MAG TPA: asparagine synthase (glutamine-hydrolyzing) [Vicinamibacterales bacterium]|jgi:asparagine synthase (glutamine-hydrolysing)